MKLWQLVSVTGNELSQLLEVARAQPAWGALHDALADYEALVAIRNRAVLDQTLPEEFVLTALGTSPRKVFISVDGWLRPNPLDASDTALSLTEGYRRYGADALDEACEYGCVSVVG
jgi:hypothetical protein